MKTAVPHLCNFRWRCLWNDNSRVARIALTAVSILLAVSPAPAQDKKPPAIVSLATTTDGRVVGVWNDRRVQAWDLATGKLRKEFRTSLSEVVALSRDGTLVASIERIGPVLVQDTATGEVIGKTAPWPGRGALRWRGALSPDGKWIGQPAWQLIVYSRVHKPQEDRDRFAEPIELDTGENRGHNSAVAFSPDGQLLAACGDDNLIRVWNMATQEETQNIATGEDEFVKNLAFSPDGKTLVFGGWEELLHADLKTGKVLGTWKIPSLDITACSFSRDGKRLVASSGHGLIHTIAGRVMVIDLEPEPKRVDWEVSDVGCRTACFTPSGKQVVSLDVNNEVKVWDITTQKVVVTCAAAADDE